MEIKHYLSGRRKREDNEKSRGAQLEPRKFTAFMANVGNAQKVQELVAFDVFDERAVPKDLEKLI